MARSPRRPDAPVLGLSGLALIAAFGLYTGAASLWIFYSFLSEGTDIARTAAFTGMVMFEKFSVFAFRSLRQPCSRIGWFSNRFLLVAFAASISVQLAVVYWPPLQSLLMTAPLALEHWTLIALAAIPLVVVPEVMKAVLPRRDVSGAPQPTT